MPKWLDYALWSFGGFSMGGVLVFTSSHTVGIISFVIGVLIIAMQLLIYRREILFETFSDAVKKSQVVWGFWFSGRTNVTQIDIDTGHIKRVVLENTENIGIPSMAKLADINTKIIKGEINALKNKIESAKTKINLVYFNKPITYSFTIFDTKPIVENKELVPRSKYAWIVVQVVEPYMNPKDYKKYVIKNRGRGKAKFQAFYNFYMSMFDSNK